MLFGNLLTTKKSKKYFCCNYVDVFRRLTGLLVYWHYLCVYLCYLCEY